jgi:3'(2'), 5'-bisphosphate nucleotidase
LSIHITPSSTYVVPEILYNQREIIFSLLTEAGEAIMSYYNADSKVEIKYKQDNTPVTDADLAANKIITEGLIKYFPDFQLISEELEIQPYQVRKNSEYIWLIDPLDGTKEFLNKTDEFSINVALIQNRRPVAGFIYLPVFKKLYYAFKGTGSFEYTENGPIQLKCSTFSLDQEGLRVVISRNHTDPLTRGEIERLRNSKKIILGSALKFISIAKGEADYYPRMIHIMEWDTAAGQIIIEEAGGSIEDALTGKPLEYNKQSLVNPFFIASGEII